MGDVPLTGVGLDAGHELLVLLHRQPRLRARETAFVACITDEGSAYAASIAAWTGTSLSRLYRPRLAAPALMTCRGSPGRSFELRREGSRELVEGALGAVLLWDVVDVVEPPRGCHRCHVNRCHLGCEHGLDLRRRGAEPG